MDQNTVVSIISMAFAVFSPLLIAYVKRDSWHSLVKTAVPILVSLGIAVGWMYLTGQVERGSVEAWVRNILYVYGAQQLFYTTVLKQWATVIEGASNGRLNEEPAPGRHEAQ